MKASSYQRALVILIAIGAIGATTLIVLQIFREPGHNAGGVSTSNATDFPAPAFTLTDQHGGPFGSDQLKNRIYLVNFIFTRCPGPCLALTHEMKALHTQLKKHSRWSDVRLLTITVDPQFDKPDVFKDYIAAHQIDDEHWHFLTGSGPDIRQVVGDGFKQTIQDSSDEPNHIITHSQKIMVVNEQGMVCGWYEGVDGWQGEYEIKNEREALQAKLKQLLSDD